MFPAARSLRSLSQCKGIGRRCLKQAASPAAGPGFCRFFNDFGEGTDNESASQDGDKQTLYKQDLIEMVAIETGLSARNVTKVVNSAIEKIIATVADDNKFVSVFTTRSCRRLVLETLNRMRAPRLHATRHFY